MVEIGPRGFNYPEHYHFIKESGITIFSPKEVYEKAQKSLEKHLKLRGNSTEAIYVTVDIDSLDMAYALGSGGQEPASESFSIWQK